MSRSNHYVVWTDASYCDGRVGLGILVKHPNGTRTEHTHTTIFRGTDYNTFEAEMLALYMALRHHVAEERVKVFLFTDNQTLVRLLTIHARSLKEPLSNRDAKCLRRHQGSALFSDLVETLARFDARIAYVPRRSNDETRLVDKLAEQARKTLGVAQAAPIRKEPLHNPVGPVLDASEKERRAIRLAHRKAAADFRGGGWYLD